jgi:hypothetical protein
MKDDGSMCVAWNIFVFIVGCGVGVGVHEWAGRLRKAELPNDSIVDMRDAQEVKVPSELEKLVKNAMRESTPEEKRQQELTRKAIELSDRRAELRRLNREGKLSVEEWQQKVAEMKPEYDALKAEEIPTPPPVK